MQKPWAAGWLLTWHQRAYLQCSADACSRLVIAHAPPPVEAHSLVDLHELALKHSPLKRCRGSSLEFRTQSIKC